MRVVAEKIIAHETQRAEVETPVVLVSVDSDAAGDFDADARELAETVLAYAQS